MVTSFSYQAIGALEGARTSPLWTLAAQGNSNGRANGGAGSEIDEQNVGKNLIQGGKGTGDANKNARPSDDENDPPYGLKKPIVPQPLPPVLTPAGNYKPKSAAAFRSAEEAVALEAELLSPEFKYNSRDAGTTTSPRDMVLLVLGVDGTEPSFQAITSFLDHSAIPYRAVLKRTQPLPQLTDGVKGFYQGVILSTGNLAYCTATCQSAMSDAEWGVLDQYTREFGVRTVAYYAWPEPRYGMTYVSALALNGTTANISFLTASSSVFPYLNRTNPLKAEWTYAYLSNPTPAQGETTTPILTMNGLTVGAVHRKADGREYLALTFDHNPNLNHSLALNYGLVNWVTRGVFLGVRKTYYMPQNDDHFLASNLFVASDPRCIPGAFTSDPTSSSMDNCPTARMTSSDINNLSSWQDRWRARSQFANFKLAMAFNGYGTPTGGGVNNGDALSTWSTLLRSKFHWVSHTFDHENLDCFRPVPNSGICTPATYAQSVTEITENIRVANAMGLPLDRASMVTPAISGLTNPNFLAAAAANGIRYLVSDMSRPEGRPAVPNTGINMSNGIFLIPRRATNIFYNTNNGNTGTNGSEPDEYNYFYGPAGRFRLPDGSPFFPTIQTWNNIIEREANTIITYMLRGEMYPLMFHQANYVRFNTSRTLFTDLTDAVFNKWSAISTLPVLSPGQSEIGVALQELMAYRAANVKGTWYPGSRIVLTATGTSKVPVTGICTTGCQTYGTERVSYVPLSAGQTLTVTPAP
ncbi:MAG: hypothetical protein JNK87_40785 [Bryobacterales bacterium]|nr:hypothetical protein [Bryobacterales bacterium]